MSETSLSSLPDEILATITGYLDIPTILAISSTSRRFRNIADEPSIWRSLCQREFRFWDDKKKFRRSLSDPSSHDWKNLVIERVKNFKSVSQSVQDLIEDPVGRSDRVQAIVEGGYGSKDALLKAYRVAPDSPNYLAQRYWSWVALGSLHRTTAVKEWDKIKFRDDVEDITERALAALDLFVLDQKDIGDIDDIFDTLQSYAQSVRKAHPDIDGQTPRQKASTIAAHLREQHWIGLDNDNRYYSLDNMFLGVALYSSHHNSSPLLSSVIFCYVCRQFGLRAQPCSYPVHVHSLVEPPEGYDLEGNPLSSSDTTSGSASASPQQRLYMDPFNHTEPVPLSRLQQQLRLVGRGLREEDLQFALEPASYRDLVVRSANNIINSVTQHNPQHTYQIEIESAVYAARFALATFPTNPDLVRSHLTDLTQTFLHNFDYDVHIFRSHIMPLTTGLPDHLAYRNLSAQLLQCELERPTPKRRGNIPPSTSPTASQTPAPSSSSSSPTSTLFSPLTNMLSSTSRAPQPENQRVIYKIGQVFRHRRAGYLAAIYGWDTTCIMSNQWITFNNVDSLPRGRYQPFYNAIVADDGSTRYVAQENIILLGAPGAGGSGEVVEESDVDSFGVQVGGWFRRFDYEKGVFVSNLRDVYPED